MALATHEVKAVSSAVVSPVRTRADIINGGSNRVLMSTTADIRWTADGSTDPVITAGSEVGHLLRSTDLGVSLSMDAFLNLKMIRVSADARVQFSFVDVTVYSPR